MSRIKIMINGIPGNVAANVAKHVLMDNHFELMPFSLTGPEIKETEYKIDSNIIRLVSPEFRDQFVSEIKNHDFISVDYTHPLAVNDNAGFYCKNNLPFVMGTTGGDRKLLEETVESSSIPAVIAPNMAKQIVGLQAMMDWASKTFPDLFKGYSLEIKESHQKGKADTSGTARAMVKYFNSLGISFSEKDIIKERDPEVQKNQWEVPEKYLGGHGYHTYTLISPDKTANFLFSHNINGRDIYAEGTLDAVAYLDDKVKKGIKGKVFTMIDVLKGI